MSRIQELRELLATAHGQLSALSDHRLTFRANLPFSEIDRWNAESERLELSTRRAYEQVIVALQRALDGGEIIDVNAPPMTDREELLAHLRIDVATLKAMAENCRKFWGAPEAGRIIDGICERVTDAADVLEGIGR